MITPTFIREKDVTEMFAAFSRSFHLAQGQESCDHRTLVLALVEFQEDWMGGKGTKASSVFLLFFSLLYLHCILITSHLFSIAAKRG